MLEVTSFDLRHIDAMEFLRSFSDESVDLITTDPPYESLEIHRARGTTTRLSHSTKSSNDWFEIFRDSQFPALFKECYRVLKPNTHLYMFCDQTTMWKVRPMLEEAGFDWHKCLIWDKCLAPETLVMTELGARPIGTLVAGDLVYTDEGRLTPVIATRRTTKSRLRLKFNDGTEITCSEEHPFYLRDGTQIEAKDMRTGTVLKTAQLGKEGTTKAISSLDLIPEEDQVLMLPDKLTCLFCGERFVSARKCAYHQGKSCKFARTKSSIANETKGAWVCHFDRSMSNPGCVLTSIEPVGVGELSDIAIEAPHRYMLANGLVTHNCSIGMGYHWRAQHEMIAFCSKGKRKLNDLGVGDVISEKRLRGKVVDEVGERRDPYATEKPVSVLSALIANSSNVGELVVDPFMGSGSAGVAAIKLGRKFAGADIEQKAIDLARKRLEAVLNEGNLKLSDTSAT